MRALSWTEQATGDLAAIHAYISQDSSHYATVVVQQLIAAADQLMLFPESGRAVPEFASPEVREIVRRGYRVVYRLFGVGEIHILTIHHGSKQFPTEF